jgi:hypothetical protein
MDPVICIELAIDQIKPLLGFDAETKLLTATYRFATRTVLGFCAPDLKKSPEVSGIFNEVPAANGGWHLELGVELADRLPAIDGMSEAILDVKTPDGANRKLCISNRMSRLAFADDSQSYHTLLPRTQAWHGSAHVRGKDGTSLPAAEEQLRTMVSMRFAVNGATAEAAFESSIANCLEIFFAAINTLLRAVRDCRKGFTPVTRAMRRDGVGSVYVLMIGDGRESAAQLALNLARIGMVSEVLTGEQTNRIRDLVNGTLALTDIDQLLDEARSSYEDGEYEFAFLQAVIAAEITTARAVRAECEKRGISKSKLDDNRKEMTYSWALNIGLPLCFPPDKRPRAELVSAMNAARSKRNDLMHEGVFSISRQQLGQLLADTREYISSIRATAEQREKH